MQMKRPGRQLKRYSFIGSPCTLQEMGEKKKGSARFCLFFFLFACSNGVCGYRRNETILLAFDIASDMTKNSCNKKQLANFLW